MLRIFALLICLILPGLALAEDRPRAGLMWNLSGLPATFPLIVKTLPGKDYVLFVDDPATDRPVMSGYIRGGNHFRLLLPPGSWTLRFAFGKDWQGEDQLFGPETGWAKTDAPLDFHVIGIDRRRAYIVTLIEQNGKLRIADMQADAECQRVIWHSENREWPEDPPGPTLEQRERLFGPQEETPFEKRPRLRYLDQSYEIFTHLCA
jgi:hypothetical protein